MENKIINVRNSYIHRCFVASLICIGSLIVMLFGGVLTKDSSVGINVVGQILLIVLLFAVTPISLVIGIVYFIKVMLSNKGADKIRLRNFYLKISGLVLLISFLISVLFSQSYVNSIDNVGGDSNAIQSNELTYTGCSRTVPYEMPPEFQRALSLFNQRIPAFGEEIRKKDPNFFNCLDIQYMTPEQKMDPAFEAVFVTPASFERDRLRIYLNEKYTESDDLITAILLSHELSHAAERAINSIAGDPIKCAETEYNAFLVESMFVTSLNKGESYALSNRLSALSENFNPNDPGLNMLQALNQIVALIYGAEHECKATYTYGTEEFKSCRSKILQQTTKRLVDESEAYQKHCNLPKTN